jgi:hypothetical protein
MLVVATTLVTDARSKMVAAVAAGESGSSVKRPKPWSPTRLPRCVIATEAAGKTRSAMACWINSKAGAKTASCCSWAGAGKGVPLPAAEFVPGKLFGEKVVGSMFGL